MNVDEQFVRNTWPNVLYFEGGDGCHIEIHELEHPHFYGNCSSNAWEKVAEWTRSQLLKPEAAREDESK